jgi:metal-responsive CopG/Arc/MetJ family transcriptional regulator
MRVHINLEDELVEELDRRAGPRGRSAYIVSTLRRALEDERRWERIASAAGSIEGSGHAWDEDPAAWVASQRQSDARRVG